MFVSQLHSSLANTMILFMLACGAWGLWEGLRTGLSGSFAGALVIGESLILVQGLLGIIAYLTGLRPGQGLHFLYGLTAAITLPSIYAFTRNRSSNIQALWLGAGAFFIVGLAIRGQMTGIG